MPLTLAFLFALSLGCFSHALMPEMPLMAFSPFLALAFLRLSLIKSLWLALAAGLCLDLLSSGDRLGAFILAYLFTTLLLHRLRKHFFEDQIVAFSLYCASISALTTLWLALVSSVSEPHFQWSPEFFAVDLVLLPCLDGLCGFLLFVFPHIVYVHARKKARLYLGNMAWKKS